MSVMDVQLKRAYEPALASDGYRVLVDRLWPRGVTRERAHLDEWARELAPSGTLRTWFGHDPARFAQFRLRYAEELAEQESKLRELRRRARNGPLTLVYGARDTEHNDAVVLAEILRREPPPRKEDS
jgi:uncharacterized protein YeaO (DUF488 family)